MIVPTLTLLQALRVHGHEVILADGGSHDGTPELARALVDQIISSEPGRARQMNAGAARAQGEVLWFVHADTLVPAHAEQLILDALHNSTRQWGRFDVRLSGRDKRLRMIAWFMNLRSRLSGIATGDQGIFVSRTLFEQVGGYAELPLMEDIELCRRLKRRHRPLCLRQQLVTSSRRWEARGIWRTMLLMWRLRLYYALGVDAHTLARLYH